MTELTPMSVVQCYRRAKERRVTWEQHWQECYDFALPRREATAGDALPGEKKTDKLFDSTAPDAVDELAAALLSQLTPPWSRWFSLAGGTETNADERAAIAPELDRIATALQSNFDRSNFALEVHQCYLDLVTVGTACLLFEEAPLGQPVAFRFTAVPMAQVAMEEGPYGRLDVTYRRCEFTDAQLRSRFPDAPLPAAQDGRSPSDPEIRFPVIEAVVPEGAGYGYMAVLDDEGAFDGEPVLLAEGRFRQSPFINFRWLKAPGEIYGRSPTMKALPDIKTANKVVELVLKNASIAVTGIWQADDDGVLNPALVTLTPGTIIPKAVGWAGLTPLRTNVDFNISDVVLERLQGNIRKALFSEQLGPMGGPRMSATEVFARTADVARILGATYGRLQTELLTPLIDRAIAVLARRGDISQLSIDGRVVDVEYRSALQDQQAQKQVETTVAWFNIVRDAGFDPSEFADLRTGAVWLARAMGVPESIVNERTVGPAPPPAAGTAPLIGEASDEAP